MARQRPQRREPPTPEEREAMLRAAGAYLTVIYEVITGTGDHAEHTREQVGRCVYCSCGTRAQGRMSDSA